MKYDSVNRIRHLAAIRHAKAAAVRAASDDAQDARSRLGRATARRQDIEVQFHPRDAHEALKQADADIAALREELETAEARRQAAGQQFQAAGAVHESAVKFATEHGFPMPADEAREASATRRVAPVEGQS